MGNALYWNLLSPEGRANCTGDLCSFLCCERFAWRVTGRLQQDWNERVQPKINCLIYQNYKQVFGKSGVQALLSFHLYLLSSTNEPESAVPTIFILTGDKRAASRARKIITKHQLFKQLNTGFEVTFEGKSIFMRVGQTGTGTSVDSERQRSLCGARVVIKSTPDEDDVLWQHATIFCTIRISQRFFAILPAHAFFPPTVPRAFAEKRTENSDTSSNTSSEGNSIFDDASTGDDEPQSDGFTPHEQGDRFLGDRYVYLDQNISGSAGDVQNLPLLGVFDSRKDQSRLLRTSTYNRELDYVLIEVQDEALMKENSVCTPSGERFDISSIETNLQDETVLVASGSDGVRSAKISSTAATLLLPWSPMPCTVWELDCDLPAGSSGSPVLTHTGKLVGMVVAALPDHGISYVLPALRILTGIKSSQNQWFLVRNRIKEGAELSADLLLNLQPTFAGTEQHLELTKDEQGLPGQSGDDEAILAGDDPRATLPVRSPSPGPVNVKAEQEATDQVLDMTESLPVDPLDQSSAAQANELERIIHTQMQQLAQHNFKVAMEATERHTSAKIRIAKLTEQLAKQEKELNDRKSTHAVELQREAQLHERLGTLRRELKDLQLGTDQTQKAREIVTSPAETVRHPEQHKSASGPDPRERRAVSPGEITYDRRRKIRVAEAIKQGAEPDSRGISTGQVPSPEDLGKVHEGMTHPYSPAIKGVTKGGIVANARWTKINRELVNPEALERAHERFEERSDYLIVLRVLTREEIEKLANMTKEIRKIRKRERQRNDEHRQRRSDDGIGLATSNRELDHKNSTTTESHEQSTDPMTGNIGKQRAGFDVSSPRSTREMVENASERPTWVRIHRKHILPQTLDHYKLDWDYDQDDSNYIVIKEYIGHRLQQELFAHSKAIQGTRQKQKLAPCPAGEASTFSVPASSINPFKARSSEDYPEGKGAQTRERWRAVPGHPRYVDSHDPRESYHRAPQLESKADSNSYSGEGYDQEGETEYRSSDPVKLARQTMYGTWR